MELGHRVGVAGEAQAGDGHVEGIAADADHLLVAEVEVGAHLAEHAVVVGLVAGGHGRVGGEDDQVAHVGPGVLEGLAADHRLAHQLEAGEDRVALVEVVDVHLVAHGAEQPNPAHAQQHLLGDAVVVAAAVEAPGDPAEALLHRLDQIERRVAVAIALPRAALHLVPLHGHQEAHARVLEEVVLLCGELVVRIAVGADLLAGVALAPVEADGDQRLLEIACALDVIAGEDAEAAGVDGQLFVQPVLHAKIGDAGLGHFKASPAGRLSGPSTASSRPI